MFNKDVRSLLTNLESIHQRYITCLVGFGKGLNQKIYTIWTD